MDSKLLFVGLVLLNSWVFVGFSRHVSLDDSNSDPAPDTSCLQNLLPCKPFLKSSSSPPASCCVPLKEIISKNVDCLCNMFNNPEILKSLNVTQDEALNLPKACAANADISKCKNASSPTSPAKPSSPPGGGPSSNSTNSPPASAANGIPQFAGFGFISIVVALGFSSF